MHRVLKLFMERLARECTHGCCVEEADDVNDEVEGDGVGGAEVAVAAGK